MNEHTMRDVPKLLVGFNDLIALRNIIRGYLAYMRRSRLPVQEKYRQVQLLEGIYTRLVGIPAHALEVIIPLTAEEMDALNSAMLGFAAFVRQKVSPSSERNKTLQSLEALRQHLLEMLAPRL